MQKNHEYFMGEAIKLSKKNVTSGHGGPFGAVIVRNGEIIGKSQNKVLKNNDPTAHGEVSAIRDACKKLKTYDLSGSVIYTSCEPCPMCLMSLMWANVETIYFAATRADAGNIGFRDDAMYNLLKSDVNSGIHMENMNKKAVKVMQLWKEKMDKMY
ncbi:MAG: Guanine deaminase [Alphaproteobacteria bacterium ADurb.Bin438]|nr:MAG: Guanine deaminase [Alphaproteobacteria bacterium ADurb.Bin438]